MRYIRSFAYILIFTLTIISLSYADNQTDIKKEPEAVVVFGDRALECSEDALAAWISYGVVRALWLDERFYKQNPDDSDYRYTFAEELEAREMLVGMWEQFRADNPKLSDAYLDTLLHVKEAGFLSEYVWTFFWTTSWGTPPQELRLKDFKKWRKINLIDHKPETLVTAKKDQSNNR